MPWPHREAEVSAAPALTPAFEPPSFCVTEDRIGPHEYSNHPVNFAQRFQKAIAPRRHIACEFALYFISALIIGCVPSGQYTSKDLTNLPCERKTNEFFFPLEFDETGNYVYADQAPAIEKALERYQRVYVFVHGWDKTPKLAESDYQDFICRFHTHSNRDEINTKNAIIIGVFWPSADFPPLLNFWRMKNRADDLALTGFQDLIKLLAKPAIQSRSHYDLVLIGHSFGGRIILKGITHYTAQLTPETHRFLSSLNQLQIVLINTAMGEHMLLPIRRLTEDLLGFSREWDSEAFIQEMVNEYGRQFTSKELLMDVRKLQLQWHPTLVQLGGLTDLRIFNIFSTNDNANRFLYPIGSFMETGGPTCGIGACGVTQWSNVVSATSAGSLESLLDLARSNLWNVDASRVILSHTDIYKGRIANLVWELIALPRPLDKEIEVTGYTGDMHGLHDYYKFISHSNQIAMKEINRFRRLGEVGLRAVNELSVLAFGAAEELRKRNWFAAEKGIREIAKLKYFYPGWFVNLGFGIVEQGRFFDSSSVLSEWEPLSQEFIHLLLAYVLVEQGRCDEAVQEVEEARRSSELYAVKEKIFLKALGEYKVKLRHCHE